MVGLKFVNVSGSKNLMYGRQCSQEAGSPIFLEVLQAFVKRDLHGFLVFLPESFYHIPERLVAVCQRLADRGDYRRIGIAIVRVVDVKEVIILAHDGGNAAAHKVVVLLRDDVLYETVAFVNFCQGSGSEVQYRQHLLHAAGKFPALFPLTLLQVNAELCGRADEIKYVAPKQMIVNADHNNSNTNMFARMLRA